MHQQSMKQVRRAALWLANDVKVRQAAKAELFPVSVAQMPTETVSHPVARVSEAF